MKSPTDRSTEYQSSPDPFELSALVRTIKDRPNFLHTPLRELRSRRGLSLNELANMIRMDPAHLELIERNSSFATPSLAELEKIATALGVTVDELV